MYEAKLTINGTELQLTHTNGYDISRIDGLTGVTTDVRTTVRNEGIGEWVTGTAVKGKNITISGFILDGATAKKTALISCAVPQGSGNLKVKTSASGWHTIDVWVRTSPVISQDKHSSFSLSLYAPNPSWYMVGAVRFEERLTDGTAKTITIGGDFESEYSFSAKVTGAPLSGVSLVLDQATSPKTLYLDFTPSLAVDTQLRVYREDGKLRIMAGTANKISALDITSTLWYLPKGQHTIKAVLYGDTGVGASMSISWEQRYAGIMAYGT